MAVFVSGTGRHLENLAQLIERGDLDAEIGLVVADRDDIAALDRAAQAGLQALVIEPELRRSSTALSERAFAAVDEAGCGTIILAGFLRKLVLPQGWDERILNVHPSLLPAFGGRGFYGDRVHRAVLERGCKLSGCTIHYVDEEYDHGPILAQAAVPVEAGDDASKLAARVFEAELSAYPEAIAEHLKRHDGR